MAKKDLRAQMDAARAATAFIGAAQEAHGGNEAHGVPSATAAHVAEGVADTDDPRADEPSPTQGAGRPAEDADVLLGDGAEVIERPSASAAKGKRAPRQVKNAASDVTLPAAVPDYFSAVPQGGDTVMAVVEMPGPMDDELMAGLEPEPEPTPKPKRQRKPRKKAVEEPEAPEPASNRMTAQVLVPMTAEQREHADLLAQVMKITRAEVMRQALDEYWESHKTELQAAVAAYEQLIRKLMK